MPNRLLVLLCIHPLMLSEPAADNAAAVMDVDTLSGGASDDAVAGEDDVNASPARDTLTKRFPATGLAALTSLLVTCSAP